MKLGLTPEEVTAVLANVQTVLDKGLSADVAALKKASEESSKSPESEKSPASAPASASESGSSSGSAGSADAAAAAPTEEMAPPAGGDEPPAEAPPAPPAEEGAPADDVGPDAGPDVGAAPPADPAVEPAADVAPEELEAEYAALSDEELDMHYLAAKKALWARKGAGAESPSGDMGAPAAPVPAAPAGEAPLMQDEKSYASEGSNSENASEGSEGSSAAKDEKEFPTSEASHAESSASYGEHETPFSKSEVESLQEQIAGLTKALSMVLSVPVRKGITSITQVEPKKEELTLPVDLNPSYLSEALRGKIQYLSKADKELVMKFYDRKVGADKIAHLLK